MSLTVFFDNVTIKAQETTILDDVSFTIEANQLNALIGPNGAGKTTLIHALLRFTPYQGTIRFKGLDRPPRIGFVPQKVKIDHATAITVSDFLAAGLSNRPVWLGTKKKIRERIRNALEDVGIPDRSRRMLSDLSGGEFQRVLLAQALLRNPDLLILDEPNTGIDVIGNNLFCGLVEEVHKARNMTTLLVSHDLGVVADHTHRVIGLNKRIIFEGKTDTILNGENLQHLFGPHSSHWTDERTIHQHRHAEVRS